MKVNVLTENNVKEIFNDAIKEKFAEIDEKLKKCNLLLKDIEKILESKERYR